MEETGQKHIKLIVAGGRKFDDKAWLFEQLNKRKEDISEIVCGGAKGADILGARWAERNSIPIKYFIPDWKQFGKSAGYLRNSEMADYADALLAFWDGESKGTGHMIDIATKRGMPVVICRYHKILDRAWYAAAKEMLKYDNAELELMKQACHDPERYSNTLARVAIQTYLKEIYNEKT